uniref:Protein pet117 log mitochondrial n=1 Tax=Ornithodoros turicata TaxID=34597 RepID=A0A2R5L5B5_9ACAR
MSTAAKICFVSSVTVSLGIIGYVHYRQQVEREQLHEGVIRDVERQRMRQIENLHVLQKQKDLAKQLAKDAS